MSIIAPRESQFEQRSRVERVVGASALGPVRSDPQPTGLTYEPYYGLREKPFSLTSDSRFFYHSRSHAPAFADLVAGIRRRESLNVLSGDIGTGKTTLCRAVLQNLDRKTFSAFVPDPFASREDLLKVLLVDFGVSSADDLINGRLKGASRTELSYLLYEFLGTLAPLQAFAVVIIDEAQNLSIPLLEEIRILADADGQLQVVLVGQLDLREKLKLPEMRQVDQRVSVHCTLEPLDVDGVTGYIDHRLYAAGASPDRIRFSDDAIEDLCRVSKGVPRVINRLCDRALHHGYLKRVGTIDRAILKAAIPEAIPVVIPAAIPPELAQAPRPIQPRQPDPVAQQEPDPVDAWLALVDEDAKRAGSAAPREPSRRTAGVMLPERRVAPLAADPHSPVKPRPGFVLRPQPHRSAVQVVTDRWLKRVGVVTLTLVALGIAFIGAPTIVDVSGDLVNASTELVAPPGLPGLPPAPPSRLSPGIVLPATPDISSPDAGVD